MAWFSPPTIAGAASNEATNFGTIFTSAQSISGNVSGVADSAQQNPFARVYDSSSTSGSFSGTGVQSGSIWDTNTNQPCSPAKVRYAYKEKATLSLSQDAKAPLVQRGFSENEASLLVADAFWEFFIQSITESHSDGASIVNVMSDTYHLYTMGANPINITISGALYTSREYDIRLDFVAMYHMLFRGTKLTENKCSLLFKYKDTTMRLKPLGIQLSNNAQAADVTPFSMSAIGYAYKVGTTKVGYSV